MTALRGRAIADAYADARMDERCPECSAEAHDWCVNRVTGRVRRTPCLARTANGPSVEADNSKTKPGRSGGEL